MATSRPRICRSFAGADADDVVSVDQHSAAAGGGFGQQSKNGFRGDGLAGAGFADDGQDFAGLDLEADVLDGVDVAAVGGEGDFEVVNFQDRAWPAGLCLSPTEPRLMVKILSLPLRWRPGHRWSDPGRPCRRRPSASAKARIVQVVDAFAHEGQAQHRQDDGDAGEDARPPDAGGGVRQRLVEVEAPFGGRGRFDAEAQEAEARKGQDRFGGVKREDQRERAGGVPVDVPGP